MPTITMRGYTRENTDTSHFNAKEGKSVLPEKTGDDETTTMTLSGDFPDSTYSPTIERKVSQFEDSNTY
ncbi:MAG: hypothetical protein ACREAK_04050 [Nitrosarchaeum sp.]